MNLLFASSNENKIKEIGAMLPAHFQLFGLKDIGFHEEIPETANTIEGNALLKAEFVLDYLQSHPTSLKTDAIISDDSGLEVDVLHGAPGVYSARFAGESKNDVANNKKLLRELKKSTRRNAQFKTVIAFIQNNDTKLFEGIIKGTIAFEPRGTNGFGYDPLFIPQGFRSTLAEMNFETKNSISHRAIAIKRLISFLNA